MNVPQIRLPSLAHGGGCGCKLARSVLQQLLSAHPVANPDKPLGVGIETGDDATVWKQDDGTCIASTTDFFMPMRLRPHRRHQRHLRRLCDGATPIMALAILGMPVDSCRCLPPNRFARVFSRQ